MPFDYGVLGRTGLRVGKLGVAASYGVPTAAVERAFERGVNYFYWGSWRREAFGQAICNLSSRRDRMVLVLQSYSRVARLVEWSLERALKQVRLEYADVLLLGWWNRPIPARIVDAAVKLRDRGLARYLGVSTHQRKLAPAWMSQGVFDVYHVRYNAAHRGAEREVFPYLPAEGRPGMVAYTATRWGTLLKPKGERAPAASDCYRFVLSNPAVDLCMTGPASAGQMEHALEALERGPMTAEELEWMRRVGDAVHRDDAHR